MGPTADRIRRTALGGLRMLEEDEDEADTCEAAEVEDDVNMNTVRDEIV